MISFKQYLAEGTDKKISEKEFIDGVLRDCGQFLEDFLIHKKFKPIYRGLKESGSPDFVRANVRSDRLPKDIPANVSKVVDTLFNKSLSTKARSASLFVTSSYEMSEEFGTPFIVFPTGSFETIYSQYANDLYTDWLGGSNKFILNYYKYFDKKHSFVDALKKYGLFTKDDEDWERPESHWQEFGTFKNAYQTLFYTHSMRFGKSQGDESSQKKKLLQFLVNEWWPLMDYHSGDLTAGINEGVELMLTCKSYYGIRWSSEDDVDAQYQSVIRKIKDRL